MGVYGRKELGALVLLVAGVAATGIAISAGAGPVLKSVSMREDFEKGNLAAWDFPFAEDWKILDEGNNRFLHMLRNRPPGVPRRPLQFARLKGTNVGSFDLRLRVRRGGQSMIAVFNYVDTLHFYYAHLSADRGAEQPVHNGLFIVNDEPRKRIAGTEAAPALPDREWHEVRITRNVPTGSIEVFVDGGREPLFSVIDHTLSCGEIGFGSFDETGDFDDIELKSDDAACVPGSAFRPTKSNQARRVSTAQSQTASNEELP
ncbi:MAG: hypothetical protein HYS61_03475 [Acidobacteria bacterium]|nr:hypothetical protein [Acidobacteriota bacterium]